MAETRQRRSRAVAVTLAFAAVASAPAAQAESAYRWRDGAGVQHVAERLDDVPEPYRARAAEDRHDEEAREAARQALRSAAARSSSPVAMPDDTTPARTPESAIGWNELAALMGTSPQTPAVDPCQHARELVARWQLGPSWGGTQNRSVLGEAARLCPEDQRIQVLAALSTPEPLEARPDHQSPAAALAPTPPANRQHPAGAPGDDSPVTPRTVPAKRVAPAREPDIPGPDDHFASSQTAHFDFRWADETRVNRSLGGTQEAIEDYLEDAYREVGQWLDVRPTERVPVIFYGHDDFKRRFPGSSWAWGFWDGTAIRINSSLKSAQVIRDELYHEYTHVLVSQLTGGRRPPAWLNEGLAELVEHRAQFGLDRAINPPGTLVRNIAAQSRAGLHGPLSGQFLSGGGCAGRRRAYARAYLAVVYLQDEQGMDGVQRIFRELKRGKAFDDAMSLVYPQGQKQFESDFDRWLQDHAR